VADGKQIGKHPGFAGIHSAVSLSGTPVRHQIIL